MVLQIDGFEELNLEREEEKIARYLWSDQVNGWEVVTGSMKNVMSFIRRS
jgi:hypothetical protein